MYYDLPIQTLCLHILARPRSAMLDKISVTRFLTWDLVARVSPIAGCPSSQRRQRPVVPDDAEPAACPERQRRPPPRPRRPEPASVLLEARAGVLPTRDHPVEHDGPRIGLGQVHPAGQLLLRANPLPAPTERGTHPNPSAPVYSRGSARHAPYVRRVLPRDAPFAPHVSASPEPPAEGVEVVAVADQQAGPPPAHQPQRRVVGSGHADGEVVGKVRDKRAYILLAGAAGPGRPAARGCLRLQRVDQSPVAPLRARLRQRRSMPSYQRPTRHSARSVNKRTHANRFAQNTPQLIVWESLGIKTSGQRAALPKSRFSSFYTQERKHQRVSDYRSINLTHSCSKIISKVLANRLDAELEHLILVNQSVFLKKRCIHYNFVYVQEMIKHMHKKKIPSQASHI
jgi:hypothetical protein